MGQTASAYLAYGFDLGDDCPPALEGNDYFDGVVILGHGYDWAGRFAAIQGEVYEATWDDPKKIKFPIPSSPITEERIQKLKNFCSTYGVTYKEPNWHLMAHLS